jgi:serine/threonine protein kinase
MRDIVNRTNGSSTSGSTSSSGDGGKEKTQPLTSREQAGPVAGARVHASPTVAIPLLDPTDTFQRHKTNPTTPIPRGYGRRADVWSLGIVVLEMLNGTTPWKSTAHAIHTLCLTDRPPPMNIPLPGPHDATQSAEVGAAGAEDEHNGDSGNEDGNEDGYVGATRMLGRKAACTTSAGSDDPLINPLRGALEKLFSGNARGLIGDMGGEDTSREVAVQARALLLRCFERDPRQRASCKELQQLPYAAGVARL